MIRSFMNWIEFNQYSNDCSSSEFRAKIGDNGGFFNFSNSGRREEGKWFTLSVYSIYKTILDIKTNYEKFESHSRYIEGEWRDLGPANFTDETVKTISTVQTKPLFVLINKLFRYANNLSVTDYNDNIINFSREGLDRTVSFLECIMEDFKPKAWRSDMPLDAQNIIDISRKYYEWLKGNNIECKIKDVQNIINSLLTKHFLIFTGLSGAGKTLLAQAFCRWISSHKVKAFARGMVIHSSRSDYTVYDVDQIGIIVKQSGSDTLAMVPLELVKQWANVIMNNNFTQETPSQTIQENVKDIAFSPTNNSFHSPLKALALEYINIHNNADGVINNNYALVPVGANWTGKEDILGYPDALNKDRYVRKPALDLILHAKGDPENPYFLILDEMNLSHVERYFADILSAMESDEEIELHDDRDDKGNFKDRDGVPARMTLPRNLFIIGTVNVDETTYMFSPKVLDRANVIEFRAESTQIEKYLENPCDINMLNGEGAKYAQAFVSAANQPTKLDGKYKEFLNKELKIIFDILACHDSEFGFRTAKEVSRFIQFYVMLSDAPANEAAQIKLFQDALDAQIMQKILPKMHGSQNKLGPVLKSLAMICEYGAQVAEEKIKKKENLDYLKNLDDTFEKIREKKVPALYPTSFEKIIRMLRKLKRDGFASFAEA